MKSGDKSPQSKRVVLNPVQNGATLHRIYLDHAATTPLHPAAREAMLPWLGEEGHGDGGTKGQEGIGFFGNPSSLHAEGRRARQAVDEARETLSEALGCLFGEVVFTSSGTEACNLAIIGAALANESPKRNTILLGAAEHHCVRHARPMLERLGCQVLTCPVDRYATPDLSVLADLIREDTLLVSAMHANNELGTLAPISDIARLARNAGALFFSDAVQTFLTVDYSEVNCADMIAVSAHKVNGPKGVGALVVRGGAKVKPVLPGGGQEREMRAGTENVAGIVGFGAAVKAYRDRDSKAQSEARCAFEAALARERPAGLVFSVPKRNPRLDGHSHLRFEGCSAESLLIVLDRLGVSASSGAACSAGSLEPSHVLLACGYSEVEANEGLRFTFGRNTTVEEAEEAARRVLLAVEQVRGNRHP